MESSSPLANAILRDEIALLETGSDSSGTVLFYRLINDAWHQSIAWPWCQPIPSDMTRTEGEYHALIEGLGVAKRDYSRVIVFTNSEPIIDQVHRRRSSPAELQPLRDKAIRLADRFDWIAMIPYDVKWMRSVG